MTGEYYSDILNFQGMCGWFNETTGLTKNNGLSTGAQVQGQEFLVANNTVGTLTVGLMGVGLGATFFNGRMLSNNFTYTNGTSANNQTAHRRSPNVIDQMAAQGIINSKAFSLALSNDTDRDGDQEFIYSTGKVSNWNRINHLRRHRH